MLVATCVCLFPYAILCDRPRSRACAARARRNTCMRTAAVCFQCSGIKGKVNPNTWGDSMDKNVVQLITRVKTKFTETHPISWHTQGKQTTRRLWVATQWIAHASMEPLKALIWRSLRLIQTYPYEYFLMQCVEVSCWRSFQTHLFWGLFVHALIDV